MEGAQTVMQRNMEPSCEIVTPDKAGGAARRGWLPACTMSRVVPATWVTMALSVPLQAFSRLLFPTLGRPTIATYTTD